MRLLVNSSVSPRPWVRYREASKARPLAVAFVTCYGKGSASDLVAQMVVERMVAQMVEGNEEECGYISGGRKGVGPNMVGEGLAR